MTILESARNIQSNAAAQAFAGYVASLVVAEGFHPHAAKIFAERYKRSPHLPSIQKAAVAAGNTSDSLWAGPLAPLETLASAFIEYLRPLTVIGRMSGLRKVPQNVRVPRATAGTSVNWTGQGWAAPVSQMQPDSVNVAISKISGIVVLTSELVRSSDPDATALIQADLGAAIAAFSDQNFLDPSITEVVNVRPASITNGAPTVASSGTTAAAFRADFKALVNLVTTNLVAPYLIMKPTVAVALAALDESGSSLLKNVNARGGDIGGIPVITSANVPTDANSPSNDVIVLVDAAEILLAEGGLEIDASAQVTLDLQTIPDSPATASTVQTSLWQHNMSALRANQLIRWKARRSGVAAMLTGVQL